MRKSGNKWKIAVLAVVAALTIGFVGAGDKDFEMSKNLDIYHTLFRELSIYYVDEIDPGDLVKKSIDEMLKTLDPYTEFIPESAIEDFRIQTTGQYGGIGAMIHNKGKYVEIVEPIADAPAHLAGIKAGDIIKEIDGRDIADINQDDVSELLKGEPKSKVTLTVETPYTGQTRKVDIVRQKIKMKSVPYYGMVADGIGYILLTSFTDKCTQEVKDALLSLKKDNQIKGIILDLRKNPGGLLNEAVSISNIFVDKGSEIVSTKGKVKIWNKTYYATSDPIDTGTPLAVLINSRSASASEIVSGVIQDLDRGVIVGTRSFGKGLVQTTRDLSYNTKLKLTTAKYYIPSGRCIQALDYSHRNKDGSVGKVPDSLITKFQTRVGRDVYDGGGVLPDVKVEPEMMSDIAVSLYGKNLIFDYATLYAQKHSSISEPGKFRISDEDYADFTNFLSDKDYDYTLESEKIIGDLEKAIKLEKHSNSVESELEQVRAKLSHNKEADLQLCKSEISYLLQEEIVSRYYFQEGRAIALLQNDSTLVKAIEVLNNPTEYKRLLSPQNNEKQQENN
ncbi:MAG: S41 family peptidase [Salinivirgaceae bacterium]|nr:S41 family peptidase [Salinivirgaceae bacterium]